MYAELAVLDHRRWIAALRKNNGTCSTAPYLYDVWIMSTYIISLTYLLNAASMTYYNSVILSNNALPFLNFVCYMFKLSYLGAE